MKTATAAAAEGAPLMDGGSGGGGAFGGRRDSGGSSGSGGSGSGDGDGSGWAHAVAPPPALSPPSPQATVGRPLLAQLAYLTRLALPYATPSDRRVAASSWPRHATRRAAADGVDGCARPPVGRRLRS